MLVRIMYCERKLVFAVRVIRDYIQIVSPTYHKTLASKPKFNIIYIQTFFKSF